MSPVSQPVRLGGRTEEILACSVMVDDGRCLPSPGVIHPNKTGPHHHYHHHHRHQALQSGECAARQGC